MKKVFRIPTAACAAVGAFSQAVLAGGIGYGSEPSVENGGNDAAIVLLVAVAALLVIRSIANPGPSKSAKDVEDKGE
jgi:hypothetical protein